jgi:alkylation response protein AidB-like acyl-CoA dehydrogenase
LGVNFDLTDEQQMLQAAAREFLAARLKSERIRALAESDDAFDEDLWGEMSQLNWPGLMISEKYGGQELGTIELAVLMEQLGYALTPGPILSSILAGIALETAATDEQKERYLAPLATGEQRGTLALWDAGAGWAPTDITLEPEAANGGYVLRGEKLFVLDAAKADFFIVGATGDRRFIVERDADGLSLVPTETIDATRKQYAVKLDGVKVGEDAAFGDDGAMGPARVRAYTAIAAELTGIAQRAMEMAVEYAKERKQFGRPIGSYQAVSHRCAQMLLETEAARSAVYYAAWAADNEPETAPLAASMAKAYASDAGTRVTGASLQVHGGIGFTWEHDLHLFLKRASADAVMFGDARWHREQVAQMVIDDPGVVAAEPAAVAAKYRFSSAAARAGRRRTASAR